MLLLHEDANARREMAMSGDEFVSITTTCTNYMHHLQNAV
jgi:hypothetical protein